ncbi:MAG TPA: CvpA family protein [Rickettsiales bacterium]|nr:CvpA family protein [Rickettsiales bacterium]
MTDVNVHLSINTFDIIILAVVGLSAIIAFFRGFLREILSFGAWVGAAVITIYLFPHSDEMMRHYVKNIKVAAGAGALITYFVALISISIVNSIILRYAKTGLEVGLLDNFLGLMFGLLRGIFIVSFAYIAISAVTPKGPEEPQWLKTSITKPFLKQGADILVSAAPEYMMDIEQAMKAQADHANNPQNYPAPDTKHDFHPNLNNAIR